MADLGMRAYVDGVLTDAKDTPNFNLGTDNNVAYTNMGYFRFYTGTQADFAWKRWVFSQKAFSAAEVARLKAYHAAVNARSRPAFVTPPPFVIPPDGPETPLSPTGTSGALPRHYKGVNMPAGSNDPGNFPDSARPYGYDYLYPSHADLDYFYSKGLRTIRLGFDIIRTQPINFKKLSAFEIGKIADIVQYAYTKGMYVVLNAHNFGQMWNTNYGMPGIIGADHEPELIPAFADFWRRMAQTFQHFPNVIYGLMNEPNQQSATEWKEAAVAAHNAISEVTTTQLVLLQGTFYTGAWSWTGNQSGNAEAWAGYSAFGKAPFQFEIHAYPDSDSSGTHAACKTNPQADLVGVTAWARAGGSKLFMGEFAWSQDSSCATEGPKVVQYMTSNADVWTGWTWWTGGPFFADFYFYNLNPNDSNSPVGGDKPQLTVLQANLANTF